MLLHCELVLVEFKNDKTEVQTLLLHVVLLVVQLVKLKAMLLELGVLLYMLEQNDVLL